MSRPIRNREWSAARRAGLCLAALLLLAGGAAAQQKGEDEFEEVRTDSLWVLNLQGDSVWVDSLSFDSIRTIVLEDSLSKLPSVTIDEVVLGFHPEYKITASRIRQNTNIDQLIRLNYLLRRNLVSKNEFSLTSQKDARTARETSIRKAMLQLQYLVMSGLKVGLRYNWRNTFESAQSEEKDNNNNKIHLESTYIRNFWNAFRLTLNLSGGLDAEDRKKDPKAGQSGISSLEERRGTSTITTVGLSYKPAPSFDTELKADVQRKTFTISTSKSDQVETESKEAKDGIDGLSYRLRWDRFAFAKINLSISVDKLERQFARAAGGIETTNDRKRMARLTASGDVTEKTSYNASVDYSWADKRYAIDTDRSNERLHVGSEVSIIHKLPSKIRSKLTMKRSFDEDLRFPNPGQPDGSANSDLGSVLLNLSRPIWKDTKIRATGSIGMTRRVFVDTTQDKDQLDRRFAVNLDYKPEAKIQGTALFSLNEGTAVNIDKSRSDKNETRQTWKVSPMISYRPFSGLKWTSTYTMTLIYIFKEFDEDRNTMTRVSELRSNITWDFFRNAKLVFDYRYKLDESGNFQLEGSERRFDREREGSNQKLNLKITFNLMKGVTWETGQFVQIEKRFDLVEGKELESHQNKTQIYNQVKVRRELTEKTRVTFSLKQVQDATVPIYTSTGSLRDETRKGEWEISGSLGIKL